MSKTYSIGEYVKGFLVIDIIYTEFVLQKQAITEESSELENQYTKSVKFVRWTQKSVKILYIARLYYNSSVLNFNHSNLIYSSQYF